MVRHFQIRSRVGLDGVPIIECFRFGQFSGQKAGGYEGAGGWVEGFEPDATNDTDGTPIGTPDPDLVSVVDGSDPTIVSEAGGQAYLTEGSGPEPDGEAFSATRTWP